MSNRYRLAAYHLSQAVRVLCARQDLRSKVKDDDQHLYISREILAVLTAQELSAIVEDYSAQFSGPKTVVL